MYVRTKQRRKTLARGTIIRKEYSFLFLSFNLLLILLIYRHHCHHYRHHHQVIRCVFLNIWRSLCSFLHRHGLRFSTKKTGRPVPLSGPYTTTQVKWHAPLSLKSGTGGGAFFFAKKAYNLECGLEYVQAVSPIHLALRLVRRHLKVHSVSYVVNKSHIYLFLLLFFKRTEVISPCYSV